MNIFTLSLAAGAAAFAGMAQAESDLSRANVQEVVLEMGTNDDGMYFSPKEYKFETGQAYRLVMVNVDDIKHEVSLGEMSERIFTRKIEVTGADGDMVVEVKGHINEVEVGGNQTAEWFFVPVQTTDAVEIACELEGHRESGMFGFAEIF